VADNVVEVIDTVVVYALMPSFRDLSTFTTYPKLTIHYYEFTTTPIVYDIAKTTVAVIR
jgi:hypothetical protein